LAAVDPVFLLKWPLFFGVVRLLESFDRSSVNCGHQLFLCLLLWCFFFRNSPVFRCQGYIVPSGGVPCGGVHGARVVVHPRFPLTLIRIWGALSSGRFTFTSVPYEGGWPGNLTYMFFCERCPQRFWVPQEVLSFFFRAVFLTPVPFFSALSVASGLAFSRGENCLPCDFGCSSVLH